jgi:hypothetical protein
MNKTDKKIEEQIREIVDGVMMESALDGTVDGESLEDAIEELTTLIQQREREAVEGFVNMITDNLPVDKYKVLIDKEDFEGWINLYLQTLKDNNLKE